MAYRMEKHFRVPYIPSTVREELEVKTLSRGTDAIRVDKNYSLQLII